MIDQASIKGEKDTGFEPRIVDDEDKGPFECFNCEYFKNGDSCVQKTMVAKSTRPRHPDGSVVTSGPDCCEYVDRLGLKALRFIR